MVIVTTPQRDRALSLQAQPASVRESRSFVRTVLHSWGLPGLVDDAALLVSELVSNAVVHARTPLTLTVSWCLGPSRVRVTVHDDSPETPHTRDFDVRATTGRGMQIVAALADSSGVVANAVGKDVWFELVPLSTPDDERATASTDE
jgi:anti-sigma regulatory factor (Ser/Thr protein kinase)